MSTLAAPFPTPTIISSQERDWYSRSRRLSRLPEAVDACYKKREPLRKRRKEMLELYAGEHYRDGATLMPLPLFKRSLVAMQANLAGADPSVTITPRVSDRLTQLGRILEHRVSFLLRRMKLRQIEQENILNALTSEGIVKVGLDENRKVYCDVVSPDDYFIDGSARRRSEALFEGHRYRISRQRALESGIFDEDALMEIPRWEDQATSDSQSISHSGQQQTIGEFTDWIELVDTYLAPGTLSREALTVTLPGYRSEGGGNQGPTSPLMVQEFTLLPDESCYSALEFHQVPDNVTPTPPAGFWIRLSKMANQLAQAIIMADSRRKKGVVVDKNESEENVNALMNAADNFVIRGNPAAYTNIEIGGASPTARESLAMFMQMYSEESGNTDQLSGQSPRGRQGEVTATEINELSSRLSVMIDFMTGAFYDHADDVVRKITYLDMKDPNLLASVPMLVNGEEFVAKLTADMLKGVSAMDFQLEVKRGSMRQVSQQARIRRLRELGGNDIPLAIQLEMQTGGAFNATEYIRTVADGVLTPAQVERIWRPSMMQNMAMTVSTGITPPPGTGSGPLSRKPGVPGSDGMPGSTKTGAQSQNFDVGANTQRTNQAVGAGQGAGGY